MSLLQNHRRLEFLKGWKTLRNDLFSEDVVRPAYKLGLTLEDYQAGQEAGYPLDPTIGDFYETKDEADLLADKSWCTRTGRSYRYFMSNDST